MHRCTEVAYFKVDTFYFMSGFCISKVLAAGRDRFVGKKAVSCLVNRGPKSSRGIFRIFN